MVYKEDVKKKLDGILKAFRDYVRGHDYFDIVYSEKIGYFKILVKEHNTEGIEILDTPQAMLDILFNEIINDVVFSPENPKETHEELTLTEYEESESRRRISAILDTMDNEEKASYLNFLNNYLSIYQERGRRASVE